MPPLVPRSVASDLLKFLVNKKPLYPQPLPVHQISTTGTFSSGLEDQPIEIKDPINVLSRKELLNKLGCLE